MRRALGVVLGLAALAATVGLSHVPMAGPGGDGAVVRVGWSARPERVETCHRVSDDELARLPAHMRRRVVCEGTTARYGLEIRRDGVVIATDTVRGGGLRHDRELYVSRDLGVPTGPSRVTVRFVRLDSSSVREEDERTDSVSAGIPDRSVREAEERRRRRAEAIPPVLQLDTTVTIASRRVLLVTYDEPSRRLVARTAPQ
jgi:hypothetical protein